MKSKKETKPDYLEHARVLWIAEVIFNETILEWDSARKISQRIFDEIYSMPELFK